MFSLAARTASRVAVRATVQNNAFASLRHSQPVRTFAASTFLNPDEVADRIVTVVKNFDKVDPDKVATASKFAEDLGLDSLDSVEVVMAIEDEFAVEIPDAEADKISSIADAVEYISGHPMAK